MIYLQSFRRWWRWCWWYQCQWGRWRGTVMHGFVSISRLSLQCNGALTPPESDSTVSEAATEVDHNTSFKAAHIMQTMWARWSSAVHAGGFNGVVTQWQSQGVTGFTGSQCKDSQFHSFTVQTTSRVPQCTQVHISQLSGINFRCAFIYNWIALLGKALKDAMSVGRIWRDMRKPMMFFFLPEDQL